MTPLFFFNDTATTEIYTLSLHDALPISAKKSAKPKKEQPATAAPVTPENLSLSRDRKSTRLNSSHGYISYAVFCLKKKRTARVSPKREELRSAAPGARGRAVGATSPAPR